MPEPTEMQQGVTWKWVAVTFCGILVIGGAAWGTSIDTRVNRIDEKQTKATENSGQQAADIAVIKEKLRVIEDRQKEQQEATKETNKKLDELLQRARPIK